jgi:hypothetical protein
MLEEQSGPLRTPGVLAGQERLVFGEVLSKKLLSLNDPVSTRVEDLDDQPSERLRVNREKQQLSFPNQQRYRGQSSKKSFIDLCRQVNVSALNPQFR